MAKIPLKDYAEKIGKSRTSCYNKYKRGGFQSAVKLGRDIWIDENEPFLDARVTSGRYVGFRKGYAEWRRIRSGDLQEK